MDGKGAKIVTNKWLVGLATAAYGLLCGLTGVFYLHFQFWKPGYTYAAGWAMLLLAAVLLLALLTGVIRPNRPCLRTLVACAVLLMVLLFAGLPGLAVLPGAVLRISRRGQASVHPGSGAPGGADRLGCLCGQGQSPAGGGPGLSVTTFSTGRIYTGRFREYNVLVQDIQGGAP